MRAGVEVSCCPSHGEIPRDNPIVQSDRSAGRRNGCTTIRWGTLDLLPKERQKSQEDRKSATFLRKTQLLLILLPPNWRTHRVRNEIRGEHSPKETRGIVYK